MTDRTDEQVLINRMTPRLEESEIILQATQQPPKDMTLGVDVSHWQGTIDWVKMASTEVEYAITKGTDFFSSYPKGFVDKKAFINLDGMRKNRLVTGGYCWLQPKQDPKLQAEFFLNEFYSKADVDFPPVLDFEDNNVNSWNDMLWRAQVWLEIVEEETGVIPIVYTSPGYMMNFDRIKSGFLGRYPLWVAHYIQRSYPTVPYQWKDWLLWQYSDRGHYPYYIYRDTNPGSGQDYGVSSYGLDMNWFQGTKKELDDLLNVEYEEPQEPPVVDEKPLGHIKITAWVLNIRSGVGTSHPVVSQTRRGAIHPFYESKSGWYRVGKGEWLSGAWTQKVDSPEAPNQEESSEVLFKAQCTAYTLYKRSGPSGTFGIVGYLVNGAVVNVYEVKNGWYRIEPDKQVWVGSNWMKRV